MTGEEFKQKLLDRWPGIALLPCAADIDYGNTIGVDQMRRLWRKYRYGVLGYSRWFRGYVKESWDCDDYARDFIQFVRRQYATCGKATPICKIKVPGHARVAWWDGRKMQVIEPQTGELVDNQEEVYWAECL